MGKLVAGLNTLVTVCQSIGAILVVLGIVLAGIGALIDGVEYKQKLKERAKGAFIAAACIYAGPQLASWLASLFL